MDKTTFCDACKILREEDAKYCIECGNELRPVENETLVINKVNCENICKFLVDTLGYNGASWHEENFIIAKYKTDSNSLKGLELLSDPEDVLFINIEDDCIRISCLIELSEDPLNDIEFFKAVNEINSLSCLTRLSYEEPTEEDHEKVCPRASYGKLRISEIIPYLPNLPLIHLYKLCGGGFERSILVISSLSRINPLFANYFGIIVGHFHLPRNMHRTLK